MKTLNKKASKFFERIKLKPYIDYYSGKKDHDRYGKSDKKRIFLMLVPGYGNIGDQAIAQATIKYLKENFKEYELVVIPLYARFYCAGAVKSIISKDDLIFLQGGGNFGNLYMYIEESRRFIVKHFPDNKIVSFPVTITYEKSRKGKREFLRSKRIYDAHKDFTIISRDERSYEFALKNFDKARNLICPDMVFYMWEKEKESVQSVERRDIGICLRSDPEKYKGISRVDILKAISEKTDNWKIIDTQQSRPIGEETRDYEMISVKRDFAACKVIITDRLHGMILSLITGTPCVVLPTKDQKTKETYKWVKELNTVRYCENCNVDDIIKNVDELMAVEGENYIDFKTLYFKDLKSKILM